MAIKKNKVILKDLGWRKLKKELRKASKTAHVKVGVLQDAPSSSALPLASIAAVQEYGSQDGSIPARPFLAMALQKNQKTLNKLQDKSLDAVLSGKSTIAKGLTVLGEAHTAQVKQGFTELQFTPLKASTIKQKGSTRPLIDTGLLRRSIAYKVGD